MDEVASELDFEEIANTLTPDELESLYRQLGLTKAAIVHAEVDSGSIITVEKAIAVLTKWKMMKGRTSTRRFIIEALRSGNHVHKADALESYFMTPDMDNPTEAYKPGSSSSSLLDEVASDLDFFKVAKSLTPNELGSLYRQLGLIRAEIEHAMVDSASINTAEQVMAVLVKWRQRNGKLAKRGAIIKALRRGNHAHKADTLESYFMTPDMDNPTEPGKPGSSSSSSLLGAGSPKFNLEMVRRQLIEEYRETRGKLPLLPWMPEEFANIEDIFVDLEIIEEDKPSGVIRKKLDLYSDLVCIERNIGRSKNKELVKRILVRGDPGAGKSTMISKLAYDWACNKSDSPMSKFDLVFVITVCEIDPDTDLIGVIQDQLLPKISRQSLEEFLHSNASSVAILFDGYDEASRHFDQCKDIRKVLCSKWLAEAYVIVTTRPNQVGKFCRHYGPYLQVELNHSLNAQRKYAKKFLRFRKTDDDDGDDDHEEDDDDSPTKAGNSGSSSSSSFLVLSKECDANPRHVKESIWIRRRIVGQEPEAGARPPKACRLILS
ncbi:uncharacterized protein [Amphiura filiformis]|uniref:uncharacterized protein n=1 Tax=Amphiura filiformis TaxID=82378 RepID=UPI003B2118BF